MDIMYENIVRLLGAVFDNRRLYGASHKVTIQSLEQAYELLTKTLSTEDALVLSVTPEECRINHQLVETRTPLMQRFVDLLRAHELSTLTLSKEMTADEFISLVDLISREPEALADSGGVSTALHDGTFAHITSRKVTYVEITEDETVITKQELGDGSARGARDAAVMEYLGVFEEEQPASPQPFNDVVAEGMQELVADPMELGELIVRSAGAGLDVDLGREAPAPTPSATTRLLIDRIVKCLERAFSVLKEDRSARSQKGKKALIKSLQTLEDDLQSVIKEAVEPVEDDDFAPISSAIEAMTDELAIDALASEYLRKRKLIEASEKRVLRYMARHGERIDDSELKSKLIEGGMPAQNWDVLLMTSGAKSTSNATHELTESLPGLKHLQEMMGQLAGFFHDINPEDDQARARLKELIGQVEARLEQLVENTREHMARLADHVAATDPEMTIGESEASHRQSRRVLLAIIAEIVQELCQPLSVVQCTIEVLMSEQIDSVSSAQRDILELACNSTQRLGVLIQELFTIVGHPVDLNPKELTKDMHA
jgi:hypothetical protein